MTSTTVLAYIQRSVVVTEPHAGRDGGGERAELLSDRLADGLERLEPVGPFDLMNADAVGGAVIDGGEDGHLPVLFGEGGRAIGAPQLVGRFRDDVALVAPAARASRHKDLRSNWRS